MKMGKVGLLASAAAVAMFATSGAEAAQTKDKKATQNVAPATPAIQMNNPPMEAAQNAPMVLAQNYPAGPSNAELAQRLQVLEDAQAASADRASSDHARLSTLEQNFNYASWTYDNGRPVLQTGDGRFTMGFRLRMQSDFAGYSQDATHGPGFNGPSDLSSGAVMRRAYFGVEGKVYNDFAYEIRLNGGGADGGSFGASGVPNAGEGDPLLNKMVITYTGIPDWHFNVGVIEPSFMMEGTTTSKDLIWMERPEIENIAADSFGAGDSRRGIEVGWSRTDMLWPGDNLAFDLAFTGGKTGSAQNHGSQTATNSPPGAGDENSQLLGRAVERLWTDGFSNIQIGASAATVFYSGSNGNPNGGTQTLRFRDRPEIRVDGTRLIDTGGIAAKTGNMFAVDMEGNWQQFYLEGEYAQFQMDRQCGSLIMANNAACVNSSAVIDHPTFHGWTIGASWILTGETHTYVPAALAETQASFGAPVPSQPFSLQGRSWGTWEVAVRYSDTVLNWNVNQAAVTNLTGASQLAGIIGGDERVVALALNWYMNRNIRLMLDDNIITVHKGVFGNVNRDGQDINVVGMRLQFAN